MGSIETEHNPQSHTPLIFLDDSLHCQEKCLENDQVDLGVSSLASDLDVFSSEFDVFSPEDDEDQLLALFSKEEKIAHLSAYASNASKSFMVTRKGILDWMKRVSAHHDFSANTVVLGVNYFDNFMLRFGFRSYAPWTSQVAAIACLSLASKVQETRANWTHLLLDFQVDCKYTFETKTIQRMELLVLSMFEWKMNAVTPFSFFGHLLKRLKLKTHLHWQILRRFETLILSAIVDPQFLCYSPSVLAAATLVRALKDLDLWSPLEHQNQLMDLFKTSQDQVEECHKFIQELSNSDKTLKRKYVSSASSPNNVLDILLNEENPKESSVSSLLPSSPKALRKKRELGQAQLWPPGP